MRIGCWVRSFAIVTTTPNELCAQLHNRMPVVLKPDVWPVWLGEELSVIALFDGSPAGLFDGLPAIASGAL
jgi:putative SOS response-associated peptidase YedK